MNENVKLVNTTDETIFIPGLEPWKPGVEFDLPKEMALTPHIQPRILGGALKIVDGSKRMAAQEGNTPTPARKGGWRPSH